MNADERQKLKDAAQWVAFMFCEVQSTLKSEYGFAEIKALKWASILTTIMTRTPIKEEDEMPDTVDELMRKFGLNKNGGTSDN